jgi:hypothetical protein
MKWLALSLALGGCAATQARALVQPMPGMRGALIAMSDQQCRDMLTRRRVFGALGAGAAFAGGSGGILTAFPTSGDVRYAVGGASLGVGILGAIFIFLGNAQGEDFNRFCTTAPPSR